LNFFLKYKIIISRVLGIVLLIGGLVYNFWLTPKEVMSENEKAKARVERMEASVKGYSAKTYKQSDTSRFVEHMKNTQEKQVQYMFFLIMFLGTGFLGYSFLPKKDNE
jgi:hypothetical protein